MRSRSRAVGIAVMTDEQVRAYLLNELSDEESERFEDELFSADEWETDVQAVEDDLIDDYVCGELSPEQQRRFEEHFLVTDARQERLRMAQALGEHADKLTAPEKVEPSWWQKLVAGWNAKPLALRFAAGLAAVVLLAGIVWYAAIWSQRQQDFVPLSLSLVATTRGVDEKPEHVKLEGKGGVKLTLALPEPIPATATYQAELRKGTDPGIPLGSIAREGAKLIVIIPTRQLSAGSYQIKLTLIDGGGAPQPVPGAYKFIVD